MVKDLRPETGGGDFGQARHILQSITALHRRPVQVKMHHLNRECPLCYGVLLCTFFSEGYSASGQPVTQKHWEPAPGLLSITTPDFHRPANHSFAGHTSIWVRQPFHCDSVGSFGSNGSILANKSGISLAAVFQTSSKSTVS